MTSIPRRSQTKLDAGARRVEADRREEPPAGRGEPGQDRATGCCSSIAQDAAQSDVRIGLVGLDRKDKRYYAFEVLATTLGGGFTSRLTQRLREQLGITYGARAGDGLAARSRARS